MNKARYGSIHGPLVDPLEFLRLATPRYKERGIFPYCDACREIVHLYAPHTPNPNIVPRFDHPNLPSGADPLDDCSLAHRNPRFHGLAPDGFDDAHGEKVRAQFYEPEFRAQAYVFCWNLCRNRNLPREKFQSMLRRADQKRIWAYAGIPLWTIPYILLSIENFSAKAKSGREYGFHFVFQKPRGTNVSGLWKADGKSQIVKVFSSDGSWVKASDNPYPVSESAFLEKSGDISWISPDFLRSLVP